MNELIYKDIIARAPIGFAYHKVVLDESGKPVDYIILDVNHSFEQITGLHGEKIIGKKITEVMPGIDKLDFDWIGTYGEVALNQSNMNFEQFSDNLKMIFRVYVFSNEKYYFTTLFTDITDEKNEILELHKSSKQLREYFNDISKINEELGYVRGDLESALFEKNHLVELLESSKEQLETIVKEKDKFFSILAHDLKSPFTGFIGLTQMLAEQIDILEKSEIQEFSSTLNKSAEELYKLLENLLEWSRIQRGLIQFNPSETYIYFLTNEIIKFQKANLTNKEITIDNRIPSDLICIVDANMLNTVFRNLISNALKFTPKGGHIEVGLIESLKKEYIFYVKDSGIGIPPSILSKLFIVSEKTSRPGTSGESSTGLGLVLCKEYVDKHKGKIWVDSTEMEGTTFFVSIPY